MLEEFSRAATMKAAMLCILVVEKGKGVVVVLDSQNLFTGDMFVFVDVAGCRCLGGLVLFGA